MRDEEARAERAARYVRDALRPGGCDQCEGRAADLASAGGAKQMPPKDIGAATLAFHDSGHQSEAGAGVAVWLRRNKIPTSELGRLANDVVTD